MSFQRGEKKGKNARMPKCRAKICRALIALRRKTATTMKSKKQQHQNHHSYIFPKMGMRTPKTILVTSCLWSTWKPFPLHGQLASDAFSVSSVPGPHRSTRAVVTNNENTEVVYDHKQSVVHDRLYSPPDLAGRAFANLGKLQMPYPAIQTIATGRCDRKVRPSSAHI